MPRFADGGKPTSVYLIQVGPLVKIGLSVNVRKRLKSLSAGMTEDPTHVAYREFPFNAQAFAAERRLHRHFHQHRVRGEWFRIEMQEAITVLDEMPVPRWADIVNGAWKRPTHDESQAQVREAMLRGREEARAAFPPRSWAQ